MVRGRERKIYDEIETNFIHSDANGVVGLRIVFFFFIHKKVDTGVKKKKRATDNNELRTIAGRRVQFLKRCIFTISYLGFYFESSNII